MAAGAMYPPRRLPISQRLPPTTAQQPLRRKTRRSSGGASPTSAPYPSTRRTRPLPSRSRPPRSPIGAGLSRSGRSPSAVTNCGTRPRPRRAAEPRRWSGNAQSRRGWRTAVDEILHPILGCERRNIRVVSEHASFGPPNFAVERTRFAPLTAALGPLDVCIQRTEACLGEAVPTALGRLVSLAARGRRLLAWCCFWRAAGGCAPFALGEP